MRAAGVIGGVAATVVTVLGSLGAAPSAQASDFGTELNGTYRVSSNGQWARTNDVLMDEKTVVQTWTISSACVSPIECTGEVRSDQGWTASLRLDDFYYVDHDIAQWAPCPDGSLASGHQMFLLWGINPASEERVTKDIKYMAGRDITRTASGACGVNKPLVIELPVYIEKLS